MPAILTHDFFGQDAFGPALEAVSLFTPDERDAFLLGNQGPDPLFYLKLVPPLKAFENLGSDMHHEAPSPLFVSLRRAADALSENDRAVGRAYLAGFTCHYLLDRAVHPLVFWWERGLCGAGVDGLDTSDHSIVHAEIERDLDEMVLYTKRSETIETYRPYREVLRGRDEMLAVVGEVYLHSAMEPLADGEPSINRVFPIAVQSFRVAQNLFYSPNGKRTRRLERLERPILKNRYSLVRAMSHRVRAETTSDFDNRDHAPWTDPFTGEERFESFWDLYKAALGEVTGAITRVLADDFDEDSAHELTGGLNFSGERVE